MRGLWRRFLRLPQWGQYTVVLGVTVVLIAAVLPGEDGTDDEASATATTTATTTAPAPPATTTVPSTRAIAAAQREVSADDYPAALAIAAEIGMVDAVRRRISNRLAARARAASRAGNRSRARTLLRQADGYPATYALTQARASYRAATRRAAQRVAERAARRAATRARLRREAAARAAAERAAEEQAVPAPAGDCDPNYTGACLDPSSPDYDCAGGSGNGPDYTGPVRSVGNDPFDLDRDGDGDACEAAG